MAGTAIVAVAIASSLGNSAYSAIDIAAILIGLYFLWPPAASQPVSPSVESPVRAAKAPPVAEMHAANSGLSPARWVELSPKSKRTWWPEVIGVALILSVLFYIFTHQ